MITSNTRTCSFSKSSRCDCGAAMHASNISGHGHSPFGAGVSVTDLRSGAVAAFWATRLASAKLYDREGIALRPRAELAGAPHDRRSRHRRSAFSTRHAEWIARRASVLPIERSIGSASATGRGPARSRNLVRVGGQVASKGQTLTGSARRRSARSHW
jgi:hypothetical protein